MYCKVLVFQPIDHVSVSPTDRIGPTQGQREQVEGNEDVNGTAMNM